jgi:ABC-type branched-subunit amino acid transport system substrate-binding protein
MRVIKLGIVAVVFALMTFGCGDGQKVEKRDVKVGAVLSLTGQYGIYGKSIKQGMEIGIDTVNQEGGVNGKDFSVTFKDAKSTVAGAKAALKELINEDCEIVVGAETTELTREMIIVAAENEVSLITPSASSPALRKGLDDQVKRYSFRLCPTDDREAVKIAEDIPVAPPVLQDNGKGIPLVFIKLYYNRVLPLIRKDDPYTTGLWNYVAAALNSKKIDYESPPTYYDPALLQAEPGPDGEYNETMQKILVSIKGTGGKLGYQKSEKDDTKRGCVVVLGFADDVLKLLKAFKHENLDVQVYTNSAAASTEFIREAGDLSEGLLFTGIYKTKHSLYSSFASAYQRKFNEEPDLYAAYGYDAAMLLGKTLNQTENIEIMMEHPLNLRIAMNKVDFHGLTGHVAFARDNDVAKDFQLLTIVRNKRGNLEVRDALEYRFELLEDAKRRQQEALHRGS